MSFTHIAYCTDFSENAGIAFNTAVDMARKYGARLTILHVMPPVINPVMVDGEWAMPDTPKESLIQKLEERMQMEYGDRVPEGVAFELVVLDGHVSTEIIRFLEEGEIDLVVMGSYGFTGMGLVVFGSVAKRVSHKAPCSVMIVRKSDDRSES